MSLTRVSISPIFPAGILLLLGLFVLPNAANAQASDIFTLVADSRSNAVIVLPIDKNETLSFAAEELQDYIRKITGITLPIVWGAQQSQPFVRFRLEENMIGAFDGFEIDIASTGITIKSGKARGILYGVYQLLEDKGCAFVYPGDDEEIVPQHTTISFAVGRRVMQPSTEHRGLALYGLQASSVEMGRKIIDWMAKNRLNLVMVSENRPSDSFGPANGCHWHQVANELLFELERREFVVDMSEHSTHLFFPRSLYRDHPDWFALRDGKRVLGQMCYANADGLEYYGNAQAAYAALHPEIDILGTWPLDGGQHCQCDVCQDPETMIKAVSKIAEKIGAVRPDLIIEHLAYTPENSIPPKSFMVPENLSVLYCTGGEGWEGVVEQWRQTLSHAQGVYQFEYKMGDNYHSMTNTWLRPDHGCKVAYRAAKARFRGVISLFLPIENWWRSSFNVWFYARASWEPNLDVDGALTRYYKQYYGKYANTARQVFELIFDELQNEPLKKCHVAYGGRNDTPVDPEGLAQAQLGVSAILAKLDNLPMNELAPSVALRFERIRVFAEYFRLYYEVYTGKRWTDLKRLKEFSVMRPEYHNSVILYPDYIWWRLKYTYENDWD